MQKKKTDILTRAVSTVVFTNSVFFPFCVSLNFAFLLKTLQNRGFNQKTTKKNNKFYKLRNWSKYKLKTGPSMLRNIIGPILTYENVFFVVFACFQNPLLSAGRRRFLKIENKKQWTSFNL